VEGSCEQGDEPSGSLNFIAGNFLSGCVMAASQEGLISVSK
jgi:hypothetical protein